MPTTWTIAVDWDRNNDFTGTFDHFDEIQNICT
jgi:hypothetical protein